MKKRATPPTPRHRLSHSGTPAVDKPQRHGPDGIRNRTCHLDGVLCCRYTTGPCRTSYVVRSSVSPSFVTPKSVDSRNGNGERLAFLQGAFRFDPMFRACAARDFYSLRPSRLSNLPDCLPIRRNVIF